MFDKPTISNMLCIVMLLFHSDLALSRAKYHELFIFFTLLHP